MSTWSGGHIDMDAAFPASGAVRVFDLAVRLEAGMARHPAHPPFTFVLTKTHGEHPYGGGLTAVSELITTGGHVGTHVDALGHVAMHGCIHGGRDVIEGQSHAGGLAVGSVEEVPPLVGRGHLIDVEALLGRLPTPDDALGPDELERWFGQDGREAPGPGSIVLVRTGWMRFWSDANAYIGLETGLPGVSIDGARWLSARGILAGGSDTMNFEHKVPGVVCLEVHKHFLVEAGVYIMESLALDVLAAARAYDFTFLAAPLRIKGGTGSPIRPMAVVNV
jgi:kynurenine formamidase